MKHKAFGLLSIFLVLLLLQSCNMPGSTTPTETAIPPTDSLAPTPQTLEPTAIQHLAIPISAPDAQPYPDVFSSDTAPERRAPYGDSYDLNRLERPFSSDMTYIPDMDISSFSLSEEGDWYFVSIGLIGKNPNNPMGILFAVELDTNLDSYGDFLIVAEPPYTEEWSADKIKIYADTNRDTAGNSPSKSDAVFSGDGYDKLIHDLPNGVGSDVDSAWVRINAGQYATVQFAFKKSFAGSSFLYSVMSDAGVKDISRLDYVDYFTEKDAGSPVRSNQYYPLQGLYAVDNTCYQAFGFLPTGYEPKICPEIVAPQEVKEPGAPPGPTAPSCELSYAICQNMGYGDFNPYTCTCIPIG